MIQKYIMGGLALSMAGLLTFSIIQTKRVGKLKESNAELNQQVKSYKEGAILSLKLRNANKLLIQNRDQTIESLRHAEGYDIPLPSHFVDALERLRSSTQSPTGPQ